MRNRLHSFILNKKYSIPIAIILIAIGIYAFISGNSQVSHSTTIFLSGIFDTYQSFIETLANLYLKWFYVDTSISPDHIVIFEGQEIAPLENGLLLKKWTVFSLLMVWLNNARLINKISASFIFIFILLLTLPLGTASYAYHTALDIDLTAPYRIGQTIPLLAIITFYLLWIKINWSFYLLHLKKLPFIYDIYKAKRTTLIILLYFFVFLYTFIIGYFTFEPWVNFIFKISQKILLALGHEVYTSPFYLYNNEVLIFMNKSCLGYITMLLYATVIWATGNSNIKSALFIFLGIILINLANILRFVLLFTYLEKHGKYLLSIDIHDIYSAGIYIIVFILWIWWFNINTRTLTKQKRHFKEKI